MRQNILWLCRSDRANESLEFDLQLAIEIRRRASVLNDLPMKLPSEWIRGNEGPDTWSPFDKQYGTAVGPLESVPERLFQMRASRHE